MGLCGMELVLAVLPTSHIPSGARKKHPPLPFSERKSSELPSLEQQTRTQLLFEVSLGKAQLVGALGITVPLRKCCLKIELKCDCSRYSLAVNKEIEHTAMQGFVYFSVVVCKLLKSIDCSFFFQGQLPISLRKPAAVLLI